MKKKKNIQFNFKFFMIVSFSLHALAFAGVIIPQVINKKEKEQITVNISQNQDSQRGAENTPPKSALEIGSVSNSEVLKRMENIEASEQKKREERDALQKELDNLTRERSEFNQSLEQLKREQDKVLSEIRNKEMELNKKLNRITEEESRLNKLRENRDITEEQYNQLQQEIEAKKKSDQQESLRLEEEKQKAINQQRARDIYSKQLSLYVGQLQSQLFNNWNPPNYAEKEWSCVVKISSNRNQEVEKIEITRDCQDDKKFQDSITDAVKRSSPLPRPSRHIEFNDINYIELVFSID